MRTRFDSTKCTAVKPGKKVGQFQAVVYTKYTNKAGVQLWKADRTLTSAYESQPTAWDIARAAASNLGCAFIPNARNNTPCNAVPCHA